MDDGAHIGVNADLAPIPDDFAGRVEFDLHTPVAGDEIRANIQGALGRGLPGLQSLAPFARIIAGGPSARNAPLDGVTMALNGALKLFTDRGLAPTYWACCDPQGLMVEKFLAGPLPEETIYLVASKCAPEVFERLGDRRVVVWHVSDFAPAELLPVPCGSSVTTCAIPLLLRLGYPRQEIWGWDCCFGDDGETHANPQEHFYHEILDVEMEGRHFKSTRSWAMEAIDLGNKVWPIYQWLGLDITIMGDGMVRAFLAGSKAALAE